jgi:hypothetical protein
VPDKNTITELSGSVGVGAMHILGVFFVLDGRFGFLVFVEQYAQSAAWGIFVTVPLLVVSHLLGLLSILFAEALLTNVVGQRYSLAPLLVRVARVDSEHLTANFHEAEKNQRFLVGVSMSFVTLGIGSLSEVRMMGNFSSIGYVGAAASLLALILCLTIAFGMRNRVEQTIDSFESRREPN